MGRFANAWTALWQPSGTTAAKAAPTGIAGWGGWFDPSAPAPLPPQSKMDYARLAGNLSDNATVAVCLAWIRDNFPTARLQLGTCNDETGEFEAVEKHPALDVVNGQPNPWWTWRQTWGATCDALKVDGNAFWLIAGGSPFEIYWIPNAHMQVYGSRSVPIDHYLYRGFDGSVIPYPPEQIIHFRDGIDPVRPVMGLSRLKRAIRSIAGLNAAESYTAAVLRNSHAGKLLVPKEIGTVASDAGSGATLEEAEANAARRKFRMNYVGEGAGSVDVATIPFDLVDLGMGPEEMALDRILDRPEAIVSAMLGVPSLVTGLPAGDSARTYSNLEQAQKMAWLNGLVPMQDLMAETLTQHLLPHFPATDGLEFRWDRRKIDALAEQANDKVTRAVQLRTDSGRGPIATLNEARNEVGLPPVPGGDLSPLEEAEEQTRRLTEVARQSMTPGQGPGQDPDGDANAETNEKNPQVDEEETTNDSAA